MSVLSSDLRKELERACVRGRRAAEAASRSAIGTLGVLGERPPAHLSQDDRDLRRALRAKRDQLGERLGQIELLVADCAYEQWHRLLFARFLAENNLLIHPKFGVQVTLEECDELAAVLGEPDGWAVAARFAAEILPGIFRLDDPCVRLRLAPEARLELESIVQGIAAESFAADDALGWVYQFWQRERKEHVNASERKIGGSDLPPVTQLFTENYMVRFLLENSLGAWWVSRNPDSPLRSAWGHLRYNDDGIPAAGPFESWPSSLREVTVLDPCCGSGHFLVEAFSMLWRMRTEEEGISAVDAQDAVLRENLFALEIDPRCVQIAMFAVALAAWKAGGGWRRLPTPNIACSGMSAGRSSEDWEGLASSEPLQLALRRLHVLFKDANTLGSLIEPQRVATTGQEQVSLDDVDWAQLAPLLNAALANEPADPATAVLGSELLDEARAADLLSRRYTLVATNVPFLSRSKQHETLREHLALKQGVAQADLATAMMRRWLRASQTMCVVSPQNWHEKPVYEQLRVELLTRHRLALFARVGNNVWQIQAGKQPFKIPTLLSVIHRAAPTSASTITMLDIGNGPVREKRQLLATCERAITNQSLQLNNPDQRITIVPSAPGPRLEQYVVALQGLKTGDDPKYRRYFWELPQLSDRWSKFQSSAVGTKPYTGMSFIVDWCGGAGELAGAPSARVQGREAWGRRGVLVSQMGDLWVTLYLGDIFDSNASALIPKDPHLLPALWAFCSNPEYRELVRNIDNNVAVTNATLAKVPFDVERWQALAEGDVPLPRPESSDPTQWLFDGHPLVATEPLQVAVARLLGYRWPDQPAEDALTRLSDGDGIVCLPSVVGERPAADRLHEVLACALQGTWSPARASELLTASGSAKKDLEPWLRDEFFKSHCHIFKARPFIWHIWDGRKDGFGALVNYHQLNRSTLERLTYTYLGDWIERQSAGTREDVVGAEERLVASRELQRKLELILAGDTPYDIYVRWKSISQQPIGWAPELEDGVRLNIRPFVQAGVLRAKFNVKWEKDRGKNPDGSERHNDLHLTNAEKQARRRTAQDA